MAPTKEDSASFYTQIKEYARGLGAASNDSAYAISNSDVTSPAAWSLAEILKVSKHRFQPLMQVVFMDHLKTVVITQL